VTQFKSSIYLVLTTGIRAAGAVAVLKLCAFSLSVGEFGQLTQLIGAITLVSMLAASSVGPGLTRAMSAVNKEEQNEWIISAASLCTCVCICLGLMLGLFALPISNWLWGDHVFVPVLIGLGVVQAAVGISAIAQAVGVVRNKYLFVFKYSALGAIIGVTAVGGGLWFGGMPGAAWGLVANAAMPGFIAFLLRRQSAVILIKAVRVIYLKDKERVGVLLRYAAVPLAGALSIGLSQLVLREWVAVRVGWEAVGYWQAISRIADMYLQFVSVVLLGVALPRWGLAMSYRATVQPMLKLSGVLIATTSVIALTLYFLSDIVLTLLYSERFIAAEVLLPWQLFGDLFRVLAVCLSTGLLARGETGWPTIFEAGQGLLTLVGGILLTPLVAGKAPVIAYAFTYALLAAFLSLIWSLRCSEGNN